MGRECDKYWEHYDGLQRAKHRIIKRYLGGWYPKMSFSGNTRLLYIDSHAGRGRHETGHEGSPLIALRTLLEHKSRDKLLQQTEFRFIFFEIYDRNAQALKDEIARLGTLPANVHCEVHAQDYAPILHEVCETLRSEGAHLAPAFVFVDPFGFSLSMELLNSLLMFPGVELLINFMYRYVDMAIMATDASTPRATLDQLFGCSDWRALKGIADSHERSRQTIRLFASQLRAKWVTHIEMQAFNTALKYVLFHASNHPEGRRLMKETLWAVIPYPEGGTFTARERDMYDQVSLLDEPDLVPLRQWVFTTFAGQTVHYRDLREALLDTIYLDRHLHQVLRQARKLGLIQAGGYYGKFSFAQNPWFRFPAHPPTAT